MAENDNKNVAFFLHLSTTLDLKAFLDTETLTPDALHDEYGYDIDCVASMKTWLKGHPLEMAAVATSQANFKTLKQELIFAPWGPDCPSKKLLKVMTALEA